MKKAESSPDMVPETVEEEVLPEPEMEPEAVEVSVEKEPVPLDINNPDHGNLTDAERNA